MKNEKAIMVTVMAACLALCANVWPSVAPAEQSSAIPTPLAVTTTQPEVLEAPEIEESITEEEKDEVLYSKAVHDNISDSEPTANPIPSATETQVITEPEPTPREVPAVPKVQPTTEAKPAADLAPSQSVIDAQPSDTVYVCTLDL